MDVVKVCIADGCNEKSIAKGLCQKHYMRLKRHESIEQTRPTDWGAREKHPLYKTWVQVRRFRRDVTVDEWLSDFWTFVKDVGERPLFDGRLKFERVNNDELLGPNNFRWVAPQTSAKTREERADYQKEYARTRRAVDPAYQKSQDLKRHYGVDFQWYSDQLVKQNGVCSICGKQETMKIRGGTVSLAVDHDRESGKVRGLLCQLCNRGIGFLQHDEKILTRAIEYLRETS